MDDEYRCTECGCLCGPSELCWACLNELLYQKPEWNEDVCGPQL